MTLQNPLLSILIATKNRVPYCISAIKSILNSEDSDFELIVQDNSDTLDLRNYIADNVTDTRLIYNYTPPPLSSIDNFNEALGFANGEYICLIGDDDGINPEIFKIVRWASLNNVNAIVPSFNAVYHWPDSGVLDKHLADNGILTISKITGKIHHVSTLKEIRKLMRNGGQNYLDLNMSKLYHGIVKKVFMDKIRSATGKFFGGLSPDIYSSVALTLSIERIIRIDYPLTISGICNKSTSADSATGKHTGKLEDAPHLRGLNQYHWAEQVPRLYSVETIWADSAIAALRDMNRFDILEKFNIAALAVSCFKGQRSFSKIILKHYTEYYSSNNIEKTYRLLLLIIKYFELPVVKLLNRVIRKLTNEKYTFVRFGNLENTIKVSEKLSCYLSENHLSIEKIIEELNANPELYKRN